MLSTSPVTNGAISQASLFDAMYEINVAIVLLVVTAALCIWFQRSLAAASARRLFTMMTRLGLGPALAGSGSPQTRAFMKETKRRCGNCRVEEYCDRWLAGEAEGDNAFCPNAPSFRVLS